jgi:competence protein ComEC
MKSGSKNKLQIWQWSVLTVVFFVIIALVIFQNILNNQTTTISFLDVGQGDAIFIEAPNGVQVLVDAGPSVEAVRSLSAVMPFWDRTIDLIIPTHADQDHIGGFPEIFKRFTVNAVLDTSNTASTSIYEEYSKLRDDEDVPIRIASFQDTLVLDEPSGVYLRVLYPDQDISALPRNESSTILQLVHGNIEVMLTGDAGVMVEDYLVGVYNSFLESEILKAGHHGSKTSTSDLFLEVVNPEYVVVSAGEDNRYGHPHQEVVQRIKNSGAMIMETSKEGTIIFETNGVSVWRK